MATNKKITLKKRVGSTYDVLYPEVKRADILKSDTSALSTFGASVLNAQAAVTDGYASTLAANDTLVSLSSADVRSTFGIAQANYVCTIGGQPDATKLTEAECTGAGGTWTVTQAHQHPISQITNLQASLDGKVPLVNSKIPAQYFPAVNSDSLTFVHAAAGGATTAGATTLSDALNWSFALSNLLDGSGNPLPEHKGDFAIVQTAGYFVQEVATDAGKTFNFNFRQLDTSANNYADVDDYQGGANAEDAIYLEVGDRLVLTEIVKEDSTNYTLYFDVINTNYSVGTVGHKGTASLSEATTLASMSGVSNQEKVTDEKVIRDSMKDVVYEETFTFTYTLDMDEIQFMLGAPTNTTAASVGAFMLDISTGNIYECTNASPPNYTWTQRGSAPGFNRSVVDSATYFIFDNGSITKSFASNAGEDSATGTLLELEPLTNDLVFAI